MSQTSRRSESPARRHTAIGQRQRKGWHRSRHGGIARVRHLVAVAVAVAIRVRHQRVRVVGVEFRAVAQPVAVRVRHHRVGQMSANLREVRQPVTVRVIRRVVGPVAIGIRQTRIRLRLLHLFPVRQPIAVRIRHKRIAARRLLLLIVQPVAIRVRHPRSGRVADLQNVAIACRHPAEVIPLPCLPAQIARNRRVVRVIQIIRLSRRPRRKGKRLARHPRPRPFHCRIVRADPQTDHVPQRLGPQTPQHPVPLRLAGECRQPAAVGDRTHARLLPRESPQHQRKPPHPRFVAIRQPVTVRIHHIRVRVIHKNLVIVRQSIAIAVAQIRRRGHHCRVACHRARRIRNHHRVTARIRRQHRVQNETRAIRTRHIHSILFPLITQRPAARRRHRQGDRIPQIKTRPQWLRRDRWRRNQGGGVVSKPSRRGETTGPIIIINL